MSTIEIHNDPIPNKRLYGQKSISSDIRDALERLETGNCFYLTYTPQVYNICSTQASYMKRRTQKNFTLRQLYKDNEKLVGVWRTA